MELQSTVRLDEIEQRLASLERRLAADPDHAGGTPDIRALIEAAQTDPEASEVGIVVYAGTGPSDAGTIGWQMGRSWDEIRFLAGDATAALLSALASPTRIQIVGALLAGRRTTAELTEDLDQPSSGQLFHHLKDLIGAGIVHQPARGSYAIRPQHIVPLMTILCAAGDLAPGGGRHEGTEPP